MISTTLRVLHDPTRRFPEIPGLKIPSLTVLPNMIGSKLKQWRSMIDNAKIWLIFMLLLAIWFIPASWIHSIDPTAVAPDQSQWLMVIMSLITFLMIMALSWWLLNLHWRLIGLPPISTMVLHFKFFKLWQQLVFYYFSFALVLLAALGCLIAIC